VRSQGVRLAAAGQADAQRDPHRGHRAGASDGGADAISLINTVLGMAVDWRAAARCWAT
jgi:hypothetical protein